MVSHSQGRRWAAEVFVLGAAAGSIGTIVALIVLDVLGLLVGL